MADSPLKFMGWARYSNTGRIRRAWKVQRVKGGADVEVGDRIEDRGPDCESRLYIRTSGDTRYVKADEAADFFDSISDATLPPWDPPTGVDLELVEHVKWLGKCVQRIRSGGGGRLPEKLRKLADRVDPNTSDGRVVGCLQVVREGSYSNTGGSFRIWRLLEDRREIPARDYGRAGGPAHAREGDELWQEPDRLSPWRLKRNEVQIGAPEDWQLRDAFGGTIPGWGENWRERETTGHTTLPIGDIPRSERDGPHPDLYRYVSQQTEDGRPMALEPEANFHRKENRRGVYRFDRDVPEIAAEAGDVLILAYLPESRPAGSRGRLYGLEIEDIRRLKDYLYEQEGARSDAILRTFTCLSGPQGELISGAGPRSGFNKRGLYFFLDHQSRWGGRLTDFYHRLLLLKPSVKPERASEPIRASSDEGAAWELLQQVMEES